ncbi:MAG: oligosaccharide flippase family protein [Lachnospiraceae bacterium]|nr:oligosaccharide flippase family protein [Lachnospiraceae bacterium]
MLDRWKNKIENGMISNIMWSFLAKLFAMLFYFIADVFYARFLGIDAYAEWVFFFSVANMAFCIGWFGINISSKVHIAKSDERENCFGAAIGVRLGISSILFIVMIGTAPFIAGKIGYPQPYSNLGILMYIMGGMVFLNSFTEFFKQFYIGIQELRELCIITFIEYFSYCLFSIAFLLINSNPTSIAFGYCAAGMVILICNGLIISRKYDTGLMLEGIRNLPQQKKILKYAVPLVLTSLGGLVLMEMDTFMLGLFCSKEQVSVYSIAKQLVSRATNVNMAIWTGTVSSLAMITKQNFQEGKNKFKKVSRLNNATALFICLCFALFGETAIQYVYGVKYTAAGKILYLLIPYYFLYCVSSLYANFLDFMGHAKTRALWFISVILINFSFNYLLIPRSGVAGAAIATLISVIPYTLYCLYDVWHILNQQKYMKERDQNIMNTTLKIKQLYWKLVPYPCRKQIDQIRFRQYRKKVIEEIESRLKSGAEHREELQEMKKRIETHGLYVYNYSYVDRYSVKSYIKEIHYDEETRMYYTVHSGKKMFLSPKYNTAEMAAICYRNICMEQDENSPHRYLSKDFNTTDGGILVDIGAAEGFFTLDHMERFSKIYLLECDLNWIEALKKTFAKEIGKKIIIVPKFASDRNDSNCITIDSLLQHENLNQLTVKMDVEGTEAKVLNGCRHSFETAKEVSAFITCYHRPYDDKELLKYIKGFDYELSKGYMVNLFEQKLQKPYLRKGVIRAKKK